MATVTPRFDLSSEVPAIGNGGFNEDGVVGIYGKGSAKEIQNRLDARRWNEYERVMSLLAQGLGDYDFTETFPGLKITNVSDAIRRLKTELTAALSLITSQDQENNLDTRIYGIETDWASIGINTLGTIVSEYYTPGLSYRYEPSFEIIDTNSNSLKILGGKISLPDKIVTVVPSLNPDGAYEFDFPETEFSQNVEYVFGPGLSLPAGVENKIEVINGRFNIPTNTLALELLGKPIGTMTYGLGVGVKEFEYVNFSGNQTQDVSIVLVSGTVTGGFIDSSLPVSYYLGTDTFRSGDLEVIPPGYDVMVDPLSSSGKTSGITDGIYYAYFMVPETKGYLLGVNKTTGLIELEDADITISGSVKVPENHFPLYFIKGDFNPVFSSIQNTVEESRIYTYRRVSHPLESSITTSLTNDGLVDVRRFKSKPRPHFAPSWVPEGYLEHSEVVRTDVNGSEKKVLPLFVPLNLKHSKEQYTLQDIKGLTTPELEELTRLNHLYPIRFDYIYFPEEHREANSRKLGRLLTGSDGIYPDVIGFFGGVKYNNVEYTNLTDIDPGLLLEVEIISLDGTKIWKGTSSDLSSIYSWTIDNDSRLSITSMTDLTINIKVNMELAFPVYLTEFQTVLSLRYTKISSTSAGSAYKKLYDYEIGKSRNTDGITFLSNGKLQVTRKISPLENEIYNSEHYNNENVINTSVCELDFGLTQEPLWWTSSISLVNQYVLFYDGTNIKIARIGIVDPRNYFVQTLNYPMLNTESFVLDNPVLNIHQGGLGLEVNIAERPKVTAVIKGANYFKVIVASFYEDLLVNPEYQTIYTSETIDTNAWKCIGLFRRYQNDFENAQVAGSLDVLDSMRIVFRNNSNIKIIETPAMTYLNFFGFYSKVQPIVYEVPFENYFSTPSIIPAYVENFRNSQEYPKDPTIEEQYCTISLWHSQDDRFVTLTIKRDMSIVDPEDGSKIIYINSFGNDVLLTYPRFVKQCNGIEIGGYTLTDEELRISYNPYTGEETRRSSDLLYDRPSNYSIGTFLTRAETGRNSVTINKNSGDAWSEDTVPSLVERYQDLNVLLSSLINGKGFSYRMNAFNSENEGIARMISTRDKFLSVANLRTLPRSAVFVTNLGVARRAGRFTLSDRSEAFIFQKVENQTTRPSKYGVVLFSDYQISGNETSGWPNRLPLTPREELTGTEDAEVLVELGSASGSVLDSGVWNNNEKLENFEAEFIHRNNIAEDLYDLHTVRTALSYYPISNNDVLDKDVVLPTDRKFIKYGDVNTDISTPQDNQVFLYMETGFQLGMVVDQITVNPEDTIINLGYPSDPGYLYRTNFYKAGLIFQTDGAPATGLVTVSIYDQYGLVSTTDKTFYRRRTIIGSTGVEVICIDGLGTLQASRRYTIKVSVKTGQSFTTLDAKRILSGTAPEYAVRFIASNEVVDLDSSIWNENLSIKIGKEEIWTPAVKELSHPWDLFLGTLAVDRPLPFITQSREHGVIVSTDAGIKSAWYNTTSQWRELKIADSGGLRPLYFDTRKTGQAILISHDSTKIYTHNYVAGTWTRYASAITYTSIVHAEACVSYDQNGVEVAINDNGTVKYMQIFPWTNGAPGEIVDTIVAYSNITSVKIKGAPDNTAVIAVSRTNGANVDIRAIVGFPGSWNDQVILSVPTSKFQIKINQVTIFGNTPYVITSWKTSTTHYHVSIMKGVNYTGGGSLTWSENDITLVSGIAATVDNSEAVFAFYAKPGYLVYAPDPNDYYEVTGFPVAESIIDPYYTRIRRSKKLTDMVEDRSGNTLWSGYFDLRTDSLLCWSMYIPVAQSLSSGANIIKDPFEHNNWMFLDVQYSRIVFDNPFWNHVKVKHGIRYIDAVEDTIRSITSSNSIYTDKIYLILDLVTKSRVNLTNDLRTLARKVAAGMFNDWNVVNSGANLALPTYRTLSKGDERMKLIFVYVPSGPAVDKVQSVTYDYSTDAGVTYNTLAVETFSYDGNGYLVSSVWS